ncbi:MAG: KEOPS complex N(6)-L-threonylcarbamoyladenine synthase Kae1 [Desulfurococcaceae archaeon]
MIVPTRFNIPVNVPDTIHDQEIYVLGIESTSHTFGVGIISYFDKTTTLLANVNAQYKPEKGGIHPREAAQFHIKHAPALIKNALSNADISINQVDVIAVSIGPGLGPCLRVGATLARFLAAYYNKPVVPVNHAVAHIEIGKLFSGFNDPLIVYVSGGNTMVIAQREMQYRVLGETLDIPLGNLFDTFTREVGIAPPYVIGDKHAIDICAEWGDSFQPIPYTIKGSDLSFSGLLTAALKLAKKHLGDKKMLGNICNSLRETALNMLVEVAERSLMLTNKDSLLLVGGVASNIALRNKLEAVAKFYGIKYYGTPPEVAGDNGIMIAYTGLLYYLHGLYTEPNKLFIKQRLRIDEGVYPWLEKT